MTAYKGARHWVKEKGYRMAKCPDCGGMLEGAEQPNGLWCEASLLVIKVNPLGLHHYAATCDTSAHKEICDRPHMYTCTERACGWTIIVN